MRVVVPGLYMPRLFRYFVYSSRHASKPRLIKERGGGFKVLGHLIRRCTLLDSCASKAALPMPEPLAAILKQYLKTWRPNAMRLLFMNRRGRAFNANKVRTLGLHAVLERLGIPRCGLHAFRHTHSSLLLDVGAPPTVAQAQLRHSDARTTLGIYGHVVGDSQRNAVEKVAQLLRLDAPKSGKSANGFSNLELGQSRTGFVATLAHVTNNPR